MRTFGIKVPLIIDATGWGQNIDILQANWQYLQTEDPLENLIFSVHIRWQDNNPQRIKDEIEESVQIGMPLIVGEFAHLGTTGSSCGTAIAWQEIIKQSVLNEIGYLPVEREISPVIRSDGPGVRVAESILTELLFLCVFLECYLAEICSKTAVAVMRVEG